MHRDAAAYQHHTLTVSGDRRQHTSKQCRRPSLQGRLFRLDFRASFRLDMMSFQGCTKAGSATAAVLKLFCWKYTEPYKYRATVTWGNVSSTSVSQSVSPPSWPQHSMMHGRRQCCCQCPSSLCRAVAAVGPRWSRAVLLPPLLARRSCAQCGAGQLPPPWEHSCCGSGAAGSTRNDKLSPQDR